MLKAHRPRVLVVDNVADAANSLALLLRLWGYDAEACYAGGAALEAVRAHPRQVVLLDIGMPGMNGFQVAEYLRAEPGGRNAVLIAITGYTSTAYRLRAQEVGFHHYLIKPTEPDILRELLLRAAGPPGLSQAARANGDGMPKGGLPVTKWLSAEIPALRKFSARGELSLVGSS